MAAAVAPIAIASSVAGGVASIASGFAQAKGMKAQARASELDAKYARLRATQIGGQREEETNRVISQINAIRVSRGAGIDSATGRALRAKARERGDAAKRQDVANEIVSRDASLYKARGLRSGAKLAPILGFAGALGSFSDALGTAFPQKKEG